MKRLSILFTTLTLAVAMNPAQAGWFSNDDYTATQKPIVLVNGLFGFDDIAGADYFYQVPDKLESGGADVYVAPVAAANSDAARGEQLARQVEDILASTGADKVNLIGHSQGGPTTRYVASVYPDYIASVSTVGGVHHGSKVADVIQGVSDKSDTAKWLVEKIGNGLANFINLISGGDYDQDIEASLAGLTTPGMAQFNQQYPEGLPEQDCGSGNRYGSNGVQYFSWSGGKQMTNALDISDGLLSVTSLAFDQPNDGLVSTCSSHLGQVIRDDYRMNHLDEVNQLLGLHSLRETDPTALYRQQANRLKNAGL